MDQAEEPREEGRGVASEAPSAGPTGTGQAPAADAAMDAYSGAAVAAGPSRSEDEDHGARIRTTQEAVLRLLGYAVSKATIDPVETARIVEEAVPVAGMAPALVGPEQEVALWKAYNGLTTLVYPATSESIWVSEQIEVDRRWWEGGSWEEPSPVATAFRRQYRSIRNILLVTVAIFLLTQAYVIVLSSTLQTYEQFDTELVALQTQRNLLDQVAPEKTREAEGVARTTGEVTPPFKTLQDKEHRVFVRRNAARDMLRTLSWPWQFLYKEALGESQKGERRDAGDPRQGTVDRAAVPTISAPPSPALRETGREGRWPYDPVKVREDIRVQQLARPALQVTSLYILPLVLGFLGAVTHVVRRMLDSLSSKSYMLANYRTYRLRVALGGLLGIISGIVIAPAEAHGQTFSVSLILFAFLVGYSVEFAFSIFDTLIEKGRQALKATTVRPAPGKE